MLHNNKHGFGIAFDQSFSRLWKERIQQHKRPYRFFHLLRNAGNHHASVGVTDQNNVIQLLPLYFIGDIKNVGIKIEVGLQQMGSSADPR